MTELYPHQQKIIDADPKKALLPLGAGSGKTRIALLLARGRTLIIAPKTQRDDGNWPREVEKLGLSLSITVMSKEEFRRDYASLPRFDTVIIDESHTVTGATPNVRWRKGVAIPKCSQIFEAVHSYIEQHKPSRLYLCTATPARNPMNIWATAILLGHDWSFYKFRDAFYIKLPMVGREVFRPKRDTTSQLKLTSLIVKLSEGHIGRLEDYFDVPEQRVEYRHCPLSTKQLEAIESLPLSFPDPLVLVGKTHQVENGFLIEDPESPYRIFESSKIAAIDSLVAEYPKVLIFCRYKAQMWTLHHHFEKQGIETFLLSGETKDRQAVISNAEKSERCVFIAQSQISTGYELPSFRCTIFASTSYSSVDDVQGRGRTLRANALAENKYVYLYSGEIDQAVIECLKNHEDFSELLYAKKRSSLPDSVQ